MGEETICVRDLSIGYWSKYGTKVIAQKINASICSGELTCLLGENGAGKSTLLRTLSAFLRPLDGTIWLQGKSLTDYSAKELATVIGVVLTEKCDFRNMTVWELVGMGRSPYTGFWGTLSRKDKQIIEEAIAMVCIEGLKNRMVHTLSDGERQKVMIAKALTQETPVIFLDEPTAFLDYPSKVDILHLLHQLSREMKKTIFLSTHDLELALQIADQIWLMDRKKGVMIGTPEDLALDGSLENFFYHREGVAFEKTTGLYRIDNKYHAEVCIKGESERTVMVKKALRRNGIYASHTVDSKVTIYVDENTGNYMLLDGNENNKYRVTTIKELLSVLLGLLK